MRILFVDLTCTQGVFYTLTKFFRDFGVKADLLIASNVELKKSESPFFHYPESKEQKWIYKKEFPYNVFNPINFIIKELELIKFFKNYDLIVCTGVSPFWIIFANKPYVFISLGSDIDQFALYGYTGDPKNPTNKIPKIWRNKLLSNLLVKFFNFCLNKAKILIINPYQIETIKKLKINTKYTTKFPHLIDLDIFKPMDKNTKKTEKERIYKELDCNFLLFNVSRQIWKNKLLSDCKGNDKVIRAFKKFIENKNNSIKPKLMLIEKGWDVNETKNLINELNITDYVLWKKEMARKELVYYYNVSDIVLDQFELGVLALSSIEPMACGSTVMSYINQHPYKTDPPLINVCSEDEIFNSFMELSINRNLLENFGYNSYKWVQENCNKSEITKIYLDIITQV